MTLNDVERRKNFTDKSQYTGNLGINLPRMHASNPLIFPRIRPWFQEVSISKIQDTDRHSVRPLLPHLLNKYPAFNLVLEK